MKENPENGSSNSESKADCTRLRSFFLDHLNKIYCAKAHLIERLPEINDLVLFADLQHAIADTITQIEKQIKRIDKIYSMIDETYTFENCEGLIGFIEDAFKAIFEKSHDVILRDMAIISYLTYIESMEIASFEILIISAKNTHDSEIKNLLIECFKETKTDRALMLHLLKKSPRS